LEQAAERLQFELAARLRDAIRDIRRLVGKQQALLSAVRNLNLVAVCPARRPQAVELFLFSAGRLLEQREVDRALLAQPRALRTLVTELLQRYEGSRESIGTRVEQEVVDQINIVSEWLRRRSGEGRHLVLAEPLSGRLPWREVGEWLKQAADQVTASAREGPAGSAQPCLEPLSG
jgi:excinuclease UvrABC nuclease subunit